MADRSTLPPAANDSPAPDERDAAIAQLEAALADERRKSTELRDALENLRFKLDVLEKSYTKQLADARDRAAAADAELAATRERLEALEAEHDAAKSELEQARRDLARVDGARSRPVHRVPETAEPRYAPPPGRPAEYDGDEGTINTLLSAALRPSAGPRLPGSHLEARVGASADDEAPAEMLPPELVFTRKKSDDAD